MALVHTFRLDKMDFPSKNMPSGAISRGALYEFTPPTYVANDVVRIQVFTIPSGAVINYLQESHTYDGAGVLTVNSRVRIKDIVIAENFDYEFLNTGASGVNNFAAPLTVPYSVPTGESRDPIDDDIRIIQYPYIYIDIQLVSLGVTKVNGSLNVIYTMQQDS